MVAPLTPVTVTGTLMQTASLPAVGEVIAQLIQPISNGGSPLYGIEPSIETLDSNGSFSLDCVANDDPQVTPAGTFWSFTIALVGQAPYVISTIISHVFAPTIDLFSIPPVTDIPSEQNWVSRLYSINDSVVVFPPQGQGPIGLAVSPAGLRSLGFTQKYAETIGDGVSTSFSIVHNLGTEDVIYSFYDISYATPQGFIPDGFDVVTPNESLVIINPAPALNSIRVVIEG